MTKDRFVYQVESWMSIYRQHEYETDRFTADLAKMSVDELCGLKHVTRQFLDFAPSMFPLWQPQYHAKLRRSIAYLTDLQHRQQVAWGQQIHEWQERSRQDARLFKSIENPAMTKAEKINLVKQYYGWE